MEALFSIIAHAQHRRTSGSRHAVRSKEMMITEQFKRSRTSGSKFVSHRTKLPWGGNDRGNSGFSENCGRSLRNLADNNIDRATMRHHRFELDRRQT